MNSIALLATLRCEPEIHFNKEGLASFSALVSFAGARPEEGESQIRVVGFGKVTESVQGVLTHGDVVILEGRLQVETATKPDGSRGREIELIARRISRLPLPGLQPEAPPPPVSTAPPAARPTRKPKPAPVPDDSEF